MTYARGGATMEYLDQGEGAPLLMLHGWGGRRESWAPAIRDFSAKRRVLAVDFPGQGRSPEPPEPWSVAEYTAFIAGWLDEMGIRGADIFAHSFGGRVALLLAATRPELVGKMILTGCAGIRPPLTASRKARAAVYRAAGLLIRGSLKDWLAARFGSADYRALTPSMRKTFNLVVNQDLRPILPNVRASTLLVWGENDTETPLWMGEVMKKEIPDAGLVLYKDCGHFAYLDRYPDFRAVAEKFLHI